MSDGPAHDPAGAEALIDQARAARRAGDRAAAAGNLRAALALAPGRRDLRVDLAYDLIELDRVAEAEAMLAALEAEAPGEAEVLVGLGRAARRRGDHAAALPLFEAGAAAAPANFGARNDVAYALLDLGRTEAADSAFAAILAERPEDVGALLGRARVARRAGDRAAAFGLVEAALRAAPGHAGARLDAASDLIELGRAEEAEARLGALLHDAPGQVEAMLALARLLRQGGRRREAAALFARAVAARPHDAGARLDLGYEEVERGDLAAAKRLFEGVLDTHPAHSGAHVGLARIARRLGDQAGARAHLEAAIAADPGGHAARLEMAALLRDWGEIDAARPLLAEALRARPGSLEVLLHLGDLQREAGEDAAALATFAEAAALHPRAAQPLVAAAGQHRKLGQPAEAAAWLARALAVQPGHPDALAQQADLALVADDHAGCLAICEQALALHPDQLWPYLGAARALAALGEPGDAHALLDRAAALGPRPEITAGRIDVLKPRGEWPRIRAVLEGAVADIPGNFRLWLERVQCDIAYGQFDEAEAALEGAPAMSARDLARVAMLRGYIAEARWRIDEAVGHYRAALRLAPQDAGMRNELARACLLGLDLDAAAEHNAASVRLDASAARLRRESLSPAQTHLGQVLDEYRMDGAAAAALARIMALPVAERLAPLRAEVRANPGHTPSAICLVLALRQSGLLARHRPAPPEQAAIPRRIVQFWDTPEPPPDIAALMATWREHNPAWGHDRFDTQTAGAFLAEHYGRDVTLAFRRARHPAQKADLFRLAWLHLRGGLYVDADDRCLGPLEAVLPAGTTFVTYQEGYSTLSNNVLGAAASHPVIARALADAVAALNRGDSDSLWLSTGPGLITRAFAAGLAHSPLHPAEWLRGARVLERHELLQAVAVHCFARYKTTHRHWKRADFAAPPPPAPGAAAG